MAVHPSFIFAVLSAIAKNPGTVALAKVAPICGVKVVTKSKHPTQTFHVRTSRVDESGEEMVAHYRDHSCVLPDVKDYDIQEDLFLPIDAVNLAIKHMHSPVKNIDVDSVYELDQIFARSFRDRQLERIIPLCGVGLDSILSIIVKFPVDTPRYTNGKYSNVAIMSILYSGENGVASTMEFRQRYRFSPYISKAVAGNTLAYDWYQFSNLMDVLSI